jgi:hypothetical protein
MHPVMATDEIRWAELRHQERLAQAELRQPIEKQGRAKCGDGNRGDHLAFRLKGATLFMLVAVLGAIVAVVAA